MNRTFIVFLFLLLPGLLPAQKNITGRLIGPGDLSAHDFCLTNNGKLIYIAADDGIFLYEIENLELIRKWSYPGDAVIQSLVVSRDGTLMAAGSRDGRLFIQDLRGDSFSVIKCSEKQITSVDMVKYANVLVAGTMDGEIIRLDTAGNILHRYREQKNLLTRVVLNPAGNILMSSSIDGKIVFLDLEKDLVLSSEELKTKPSLDATVNLRIRNLLTAESGSLYHWLVGYDYKRTKLNRYFMNGLVTGVDITPEGDAWAACSVNGKILVHTNVCLYSAKIKGIILNRIRFIRADNRILYLVVATEKNGVRLVSTMDMKILQ
ncbi:MAG: WD40 repeat domain-containing protein [Bacteroidota bacterium]